MASALQFQFVPVLTNINVTESPWPTDMTVPLGPGPLLFLVAWVLAALACGLYALSRFRSAGRLEGVATTITLALNAVLVAHWPQIADDLTAWWQLVPFVLLLSVSMVVTIIALLLPFLRLESCRRE
ncbi:hypothetical protein [Deinococcus sp. 23YEL01]|uniref:hypothetical protein n=1 Tax=Deinococcus sp. 23YEL01 TaxID=2745871 RepID=UPI001E2CA871|nr:hypothetical protein [Deinococcus sp. 23YEL01]MCD0168167.1 hypothetical protein [Deinococcus sp. 23YEL01]